MSRRIRLLSGCVALLAATGPSFCAAQDGGAGFFRRTAGEKKCVSPYAPSKIMPSNAIVVLDPGVDPRGAPSPVLHQNEDTNELTVEIPATVHIHRYFPISPHEFQAQYFAGGPTIVAARHPYTNERVYVHLDLVAGFPKVKYEEDKIEYKFPEESFTIHFEKCGNVTTSHSRGGIVKMRCKEAKLKCKEKTLDCTQRLGVNGVVEKVGKEVQDSASGTVEWTGTLVSKSGELFITALNLFPGYQLLKSKAEDEATKHRDRAVQKVAGERARGQEYIKTLR